MIIKRISSHLKFNSINDFNSNRIRVSISYSYYSYSYSYNQFISCSHMQILKIHETNTVNQFHQQLLNFKYITHSNLKDLFQILNFKLLILVIV